jgi:hypothetical protein
VEDWLRKGLDGASERTRTLYEGLLGALLDVIGARPPRDLSAGDDRSGPGKLADRYFTRSLQITRLSLERAIRHAAADDPRRPQRRGPGKGAAGSQWQAIEELHAAAGESPKSRAKPVALDPVRGHERAFSGEDRDNKYRA